MDELTTLVIRAQTNDLDAYSALARRFQDMSVGYAFSILGDFHLAEDAAQEALVRAYLDLGKLREPSAFARWFKRIVFVRCDRITRRKRVPTFPLEADLISDMPLPDEILEKQETKTQVLDAVQSLPETEREVTTLYYLQMMLRAVDTKDLTLAMINASDALQEKIFANMSERVGTLVREHMASLEPVEEDRLSKGKALVVKLVQDLIEKGTISWPPPEKNHL